MERLSIAVEEWELYNNGILLCKWFDSSSSIEDIEEYVRNAKIENGLNGDDLELFCADWENDPLNLVNENSNIEKIFEIYDEIDEDKIETLEFLTNYQGYSLEEALENVDDVEYYCYDKMEDLVIEFIEQGLFGEGVMNLWETNSNWIDLDAMERDLSFDYTQYGDRIYRTV